MEKKYEAPIHYLMSFIGGFFGVYSILNFCDFFGNAQTANMIYLITNLLGHNFSSALIRLGGVAVYMLALGLTAYLPKHSRISLPLASVLLDGVAAFVVGFLPAGMDPVLALYPFFFATAFQWGSFKGAYGFTSSTIFSTNNLRQFTTAVTEIIFNRDSSFCLKARFFGCTLLSYHLGVAVSYILCVVWGTHSIWFVIPAAIAAVPFVCIDNGCFFTGDFQTFVQKNRT